MPEKDLYADTVARLEDALADLHCEKRKMFGCPVYFVNGSLFAGVHRGDIFLRLHAADRDAFLGEHPEAPPFEPLPGRRMKEYLVVPSAVSSEMSMLTSWLCRAHSYAASLPPKPCRRRS